MRPALSLVREEGGSVGFIFVFCHARACSGAAGPRKEAVAVDTTRSSSRIFLCEFSGSTNESTSTTTICLKPSPHLRAELAYVDAFARDDVLLGAEGYALTTLSCALDVLADGDDSGEQPVLDLGGESWPAPPAPPPASPLGGEEWPEPS